MFRRIVQILGMLSAIALVLLCSAPASSAEPPPGAVTWSRNKSDPRWVQGQATVVASSGAVWERLQYVDKWPAVFSDIKTMKVLRHEGPKWRIELETQAFDCGTHEYDVSFDTTARTAKLVIDAPGTTAVAYLTVKDGASTGQVLVTYSLYVEARGVVGWFVSEKALQSKQEQMVQRYLLDIYRAFDSSARK
jgi:hypothetical protein